MAKSVLTIFADFSLHGYAYKSRNFWFFGGIKIFDFLKVIPVNPTKWCVSCRHKKNDFHVKIPLHTECLNVGMVSVESLFLDLSQFHTVIYTQSIGEIVYFENLPTLLWYVWLSLQCPSVMFVGLINFTTVIYTQIIGEIVCVENLPTFLCMVAYRLADKISKPSSYLKGKIVGTYWKFMSEITWEVGRNSGHFPWFMKKYCKGLSQKPWPHSHNICINSFCFQWISLLMATSQNQSFFCFLFLVLFVFIKFKLFFYKREIYLNQTKFLLYIKFHLHEFTKNYTSF